MRNAAKMGAEFGKACAGGGMMDGMPKRHVRWMSERMRLEGGKFEKSDSPS
jgi:hypothetical protein